VRASRREPWETHEVLPKKKRARPDLAGGPFVSGKEISVDRESWSLHRRVGFRHRCCHHCCCAGFRLHRGFHRLRLRYSHLRHWARSRNVKAPDSCGSVRNKFVAPSTRARATDCKNAAAKSCGCCNSARFRQNAAAAHTNAAAKSRGCRNSARFRQSAGGGSYDRPLLEELGRLLAVVWRRRPRGRAIDCSRLRIPSRPGRTIRICPCCLRGLICRAIRVSEARRRVATIGCIALRFPGTLAIAGALRRTIPHDRNGRAVRVGHRRRRPILREDPLTATSAGIVGRAARAVVIHRGCVALAIVCTRRDATGRLFVIGVLRVGIF